MSKENLWHDLRKNPDDLPNNGEHVLAKHNGVSRYEVMLFSDRARPIFFANGLHYHPTEIGAWKYIELYEGDTEE